jgi:ABC-2 type transport system permease protein
VAKLLRLMGAYLKTNFSSFLEYRLSAASQLIGMFINDGMWVVFWVLYFTRFPVLRGWTVDDVLVLWASLTVSFGLVTGLLANCARIPAMVVQGQLDYYLALPKDPLLHLLISRVQPISLGDALFGPLLLIFLVKLTWMKALVFIAVALLSAVIWLGLYILTGSLTFFLGSSETLSGQIMGTILHFASYPTPIFDNIVKVILFTVLPAGFVSTLPVELVREFRWPDFALLAGAAALLLTAAVIVFRRGLRRYESGNLMVMRS